MRSLILLLSFFSLSSFADCKSMENTAITFINSYVSFIEGNSNEFPPYAWVQKNALLSNEFKAAYKKTIEAGYLEDPELGIGYDPILNAQDIPGSKGYMAISCSPEKHTVELQDKENKAFINAVELTYVDGKWLITSIGSIK